MTKSMYSSYSYTKSMGKTQINMRIDDTNLEAFKIQADKRNMTQVQYFELMLQNNADGNTIEILKARLESRDIEIIQLQNTVTRYEKITGKKMSKLRSVTFKVTEEQFAEITNMSHKAQIPKTHLFSKFFAKLGCNNEIPKLIDKTVV